MLNSHAPAPTHLLSTGNRMNNGANESSNSPLENYKVIFRRSTAKPGGGLNLIIAECNPMKAESVP